MGLGKSEFHVLIKQFFFLNKNTQFRDELDNYNGDSERSVPKVKKWFTDICCGTDKHGELRSVHWKQSKNLRYGDG